METPRDSNRSNRSKYEAGNSPERDAMIRLMKEKRAERNQTRNTIKKTQTNELRLLP